MYTSLLAPRHHAGSIGERDSGERGARRHDSLSIAMRCIGLRVAQGIQQVYVGVSSVENMRVRACAQMGRGLSETFAVGGLEETCETVEVKGRVRYPIE